jgi:putative ABC transport system permease protein
MNLALKDIRFGLVRFLIIIGCVASILTVSIGMTGHSRGMIHESMIVVDGFNADLWIVQAGRAGPFAEESRLNHNLDRRAEGVPGVQSARRFLQLSKMMTFDGHRLPVTITGLDYGKDSGAWVPLVSGRALMSNHYEAIADARLGLTVGERLWIGRDDYVVVGITSGQVDGSGEPLLFVPLNDIFEIAAAEPSEAILLRRAEVDAQSTKSGRIPIAAVALNLYPWADVNQVRRTIQAWGDVDVVPRDKQYEWIVHGRLERLRLQVLAFMILILIVTAAVVSLTIYTMTIEKVPVIALMKLIGSSDAYIAWLVLQQALLAGALSFGLAVPLGFFVFPMFPREILITPVDLAALGGAVLFVCALSSLFGIRVALRVKPQEILA